MYMLIKDCANKKRTSIVLFSSLCFHHVVPANAQTNATEFHATVTATASTNRARQKTTRQACTPGLFTASSCVKFRAANSYVLFRPVSRL